MSIDSISSMRMGRSEREAMEAPRDEADPVVDRLVEELVADGRLESVNELLNHLIGNAEPLP